MNVEDLKNMESFGDVRVVTFASGSSHDMEEMIDRELASNVPQQGAHLLLDFTHVTQITSEELGTLVGLHKRVRDLGGRLTLFGMRAEIYEVFVVTHLQTLLKIRRQD